MLLTGALCLQSNLAAKFQRLMFQNFSCGVVWAKSAYETHMGYIVFIYTFGFTLPLTIIVISYTKLIKTIRLKVR